MTAHARRLEQRLNVFGKRDVLFLSRFRQLGKIELAEICFIRRHQQPRPSNQGNEHNNSFHT
jgi:hypothetical protein